MEKSTKTNTRKRRLCSFAAREAALVGREAALAAREAALAAREAALACREAALTQREADEAAIVVPLRILQDVLQEVMQGTPGLICSYNDNPRGVRHSVAEDLRHRLWRAREDELRVEVGGRALTLDKALALHASAPGQAS